MPRGFMAEFGNAVKILNADFCEQGKKLQSDVSSFFYPAGQQIY
jgi:hypothetical protein